ncbi:hypothetical protein DYBT9623_01278 [Dyadobacter sp. CECT 9623]|uniref:Uncharacterized protein n=1 Tax=Dyadobacter linearis TaxID=2823330 RepID=A0ABN7R9S1_9BACT|nr:hypothetical protein DYBT9623_01278 [Dyadobacter sp. CECT 9623]
MSGTFFYLQQMNIQVNKKGAVITLPHLFSKNYFYQLSFALKKELYHNSSDNKINNCFL